MNNYWKNAEQINGRLAMIGFFAAVVNYGLTGWIAPGLFQKMKFKSQFTIQTEDKLMTPEAERFNGWAAMLGLIIGTVNYGLFGWIAPGLF